MIRMVNYNTVKLVEVTHISSSRKNVLCTSIDVRIGDVVVYEKESHTISNLKRKGFGTIPMHVGIVTEVNLEPDPSVTNWVVSVVDTRELLRSMLELHNVKKQLDIKKQQFQELEMLRLMAEHDAETAELLERYNRLSAMPTPTELTD